MLTGGHRGSCLRGSSTSLALVTDNFSNQLCHSATFGAKSAHQGGPTTYHI